MIVIVATTYWGHTTFKDIKWICTFKTILWKKKNHCFPYSPRVKLSPDIDSSRLEQKECSWGSLFIIRCFINTISFLKQVQEPGIMMTTSIEVKAPSHIAQPWKARNQTQLGLASKYILCVLSMHSLPSERFQEEILIPRFYPKGFLVPAVPLIGSNTFHPIIWKII